MGHSLNVENRASGEVTTYDLSFNALGTVNSLYDDSLAQMDVTTFYERGTGLMDGEGNVIADPVYDSIGSFYGGYAYVSLDDKYGLIDEAGNIALAIEYDDVDTSYYLPLSGSGEGSGYNAFGYFAVELDGKLGYVDEQGNVTCEPKYSVDVLDNNGASATYTDLEGKFHILAADGVETVVEGYEDVYPLNYLGGMFYRVTNEDYDYGVIDWHGNVVLPAQYNSINASGDGCTCCGRRLRDAGALRGHPARRRRRRVVRRLHRAGQCLRGGARAERARLQRGLQPLRRRRGRSR